MKVIKYNAASLPKIHHFKVCRAQSKAGKIGEELTDKKYSNYQIIVYLEGENEGAPAQEVANAHGMKIKPFYATYDEAVEIGKKWRDSWGKETEAKPKAKRQGIKARLEIAEAQIEKARERMRADGMTEEQIKAIFG